MAEAEISLRPRALRPGGGASSNPFAMFGKGAAPTRAAKAVAADLGPAQPKKPASEIIRYERDVLLQFSAACTGMPAGLNPAESEAVIGADDPDGAGAREAAQSLVPEIAGGDTDDRDWRSRSALPEAPPGSVAPSDAPRRPPMEPSAKASNGPALQTASDIGRRAWMPGSVSAEGDERALKAVKGVLNKLTPEKFERLLQQLLDAVKSVAVLRGLITLIFENAVAQPTFVAMYAELCRRLGTELPELSPPDGETQPMSFQKLLLNTCQDEFEGTADARAELSKLSGPELEAAERRVKQRTLGNIRLIAELFNKEVVREPIVHACVGELLGDSARVEPVEDNIEALCEMLTIAGKRLDEVTKKRSQVDGYFATLEKLSRTGKLPARMRFLLRDVLDLRGNKWIPRREKIQAKKLDEIHAEAHAELGMLPVIDIAQLPKLPGLQQLVAKPAVEEEVELFPALRGGDIDWRSASKVGSNGGLPEAKYSAFLGDYAPVADRAAQPTAAPAGGAAADGNATPPQTTAAPVECATYNKKLSQEERERRAGGLFVEYTGSHDVAEALLSTQELAAPGFLPKLVECGIRKLLEEVTEKKAQAAVTELLVTLAQRPGGYSAADLQAGVAVFSAQLEDLSMDAPLAPKLLGGVVGRALAEGVLPAAALTELASPIESAEPRRSFIVESLAQVKAEAGEKQLSAVTAELDLEQLLKSDPEIDPPDLPSVADLLASEGLA